MKTVESGVKFGHLCQICLHLLDRGNPYQQKLNKQTHAILQSQLNRPFFQGYTGGEVYDIYFKRCNGATDKLGPPKQPIIYQIVPRCFFQKKNGENKLWLVMLLGGSSQDFYVVRITPIYKPWSSAIWKGSQNPRSWGLTNHSFWLLTIPGMILQVLLVFFLFNGSDIQIPTTKNGGKRSSSPQA